METEISEPRSGFEFIEQCNKEIKKELDFGTWTLYTVSSTSGKLETQYKIFRIIKKEFNDNKELNVNEDLPNFVAWAGFSRKSFCNSTRIIMQKLDSLKKCYKAVYIICLENIKDLQKKSVEPRDKKKINDYKDDSGKLKYDLANIESNYKWRAFKNEDEIALNEEVSIIIDKILRAMNLRNVHILGKSAGAGIAIHIMNKSDIYTGLFLAVPSSPLNIRLLRNLSKEKLETIKFRFAWIVEDIYDFDWHQEEKKNEKSKDEKKYYDAEIEYIRKNIAPVNNYNSYLYNGNEETKPSDNHEIHPDFLDAICN